MRDAAVRAILGEAMACVARAVPYRLGGSGVDGCDCSGLVVRCFAAAGLTVPRVAQAQLDDTSPLIESAAAAADLVFFWGTDPSQPPDVVSHVGVWLGDGRMVHVPGEGATVRAQVVSGDLFWSGLRRAWGRPSALAALGGGEVPPAPSSLRAGTIARVAADGGLNLRRRPGRDSAPVAVLPDGSSVLLVGGPASADGLNWWQALVPGRAGWLAADFLRPVGPPPPPNPAGTAVVVDTGGDGLRVRAQPSPGGAALGVLFDGERVDVLAGPVDGAGRRWFRVRRGTLEGWSAADWLVGAPGWLAAVG